MSWFLHLKRIDNNISSISLMTTESMKDQVLVNLDCTRTCPCVDECIESPHWFGTQNGQISRLAFPSILDLHVVGTHPLWNSHLRDWGRAQVWVPFIFFKSSSKDSFYHWFREREEVKERNIGVREKHGLVASHTHTSQDQTSHVGRYRKQESNPQPLGV